MRIRQGASSANVRGSDETDTVVHALDEEGDPLCGINPAGTNPWFKEREGTKDDVTCEECMEEAAFLA